MVRVIEISRSALLEAVRHGLHDGDASQRLCRDDGIIYRPEYDGDHRDHLSLPIFAPRLTKARLMRWLDDLSFNLVHPELAISDDRRAQLRHSLDGLEDVENSLLSWVGSELTEEESTNWAHNCRLPEWDEDEADHLLAHLQVSAPSGVQYTWTKPWLERLDEAGASVQAEPGEVYRIAVPYVDVPPVVLPYSVHPCSAYVFDEQQSRAFIAWLGEWGLPDPWLDTVLKSVENVSADIGNAKLLDTSEPFAGDPPVAAWLNEYEIQIVPACRIEPSTHHLFNVLDRIPDISWTGLMELHHVIALITPRQAAGMLTAYHDRRQFERERDQFGRDIFGHQST